VVANALATLLRFVLFRGWLFRSRTGRRELGDGPAVPQGQDDLGGVRLQLPFSAVRP
jgi:hypothetical protein